LNTTLFKASSRSVEELIKAEALSLGFALCGFSSADTPPHYEAYLGWIEAGHHAEMEYMARPNAIEARYDPARLLPGCRTVISLGAAYPAPLSGNKPQRNQGKIAAYALLPDYHQVLKDRAGLLAQKITQLVDQPFKYLVCVDTAPILEKDYAQQSGLGWIARNSCLTSSTYGSWMFLCELLVDLPLAPDKPIINSDCADCHRCQMACPTKAILPNRTIDARRCLSYLTIEHRGPIPQAFRPLVGQRIFGCDTCQTICPSNQKPQRPAAFFDHSQLLDPHPDLLESFMLTESDFKSRFANTPILRAKYQGFRRNVAIALGNSRLQEARSALLDCAANELDDVVREAAQWALTQY
jgi:epoxyqueuosine reductase